MARITIAVVVLIGCDASLDRPATGAGKQGPAVDPGVPGGAGRTGAAASLERGKDMPGQDWIPVVTTTGSVACIDPDGREICRAPAPGPDPVEITIVRGNGDPGLRWRHWPVTTGGTRVAWWRSGQLVAMDVPSGAIVTRTVAGMEFVRSIAISTDGAVGFVGSATGSIVRIPLSGAEAATTTGFLPGDARILCLGTGPGPADLAAGIEGAGAYTLDAGTLAILGRAEAFGEGVVRSVSSDPTGRRLAIEHGAEFSLKVYRMDERRVGQLEGVHKVSLSRGLVAAWSSDGGSLAIGGEDGDVGVFHHFERADRELGVIPQRFRIPALTGPVVALRFVRRDGTLLASGVRGGVVALDAASGRVTWRRTIE
jgi:hypothetical protein